jgi:Protein of unknown function DUF72
MGKPIIDLSSVATVGLKVGPINWQFATAERFDAEDFAALKLLPKSADGLAICHVVEVRHESFKNPDFIALARDHPVATCGDSDCKQIIDATTPFVDARIMGTTESEQQGSSAAALGNGRSAPMGRRRLSRRPRNCSGGTAIRRDRRRGVSLCHHRPQGAKPGGCDGAHRARRMIRASALEEGEQVRIDRISMGSGHAVRKVLVALERAVFQELRGQRACGDIGHDLVVLAVHDQDRHIDLL